MAQRFYTVVDLPRGLTTIDKVEVLELLDPSGKAIEHKHLTWAIEKPYKGASKLHVKVNCPGGSLTKKGTTVKFKILPKKSVK